MSTNDDLLNEIITEVEYQKHLTHPNSIEDVIRSCGRIIQYASLIKIGKITRLPLVATRKDN